MKLLALLTLCLNATAWADLQGDLDLLFQARDQVGELRSMARSLSTARAQELQEKGMSERYKKIGTAYDYCSTVEMSLDTMQEALRKTIEFREAQKVKSKTECSNLYKAIDTDLRYDAAFYAHHTRISEDEDTKWKSGVKKTFELVDFCREQAAAFLPPGSVKPKQGDGASK